MNKKIKIAIGGIIVVIAIIIATYTISPLFINTTIDEPLPNTRTNIGFDEFMKLSEDERATIGKDMTQEEKDKIMRVFAQENVIVKDEITEHAKQGHLKTEVAGVVVNCPFVET